MFGGHGWHKILCPVRGMEGHWPPPNRQETKLQWDRVNVPRLGQLGCAGAWP